MVKSMAMGRSNYFQQFYIFYISWFSELIILDQIKFVNLLSREEGLSLAKNNEFKYDVLKKLIGFNLDDVLSKLSLYLNYISIG